jgi:hypothetical protein
VYSSISTNLVLLMPIGLLTAACYSEYVLGGAVSRPVAIGYGMVHFVCCLVSARVRCYAAAWCTSNTFVCHGLCHVVCGARRHFVTAVGGLAVVMVSCRLCAPHVFDTCGGFLFRALLGRVGCSPHSGVVFGPLLSVVPGALPPSSMYRAPAKDSTSVVLDAFACFAVVQPVGGHGFMCSLTMALLLLCAPWCRSGCTPGRLACQVGVAWCGLCLASWCCTPSCT